MCDLNTETETNAATESRSHDGLVRVMKDGTKIYPEKVRNPDDVGCSFIGVWEGQSRSIWYGQELGGKIVTDLSVVRNKDPFKTLVPTLINP